MMISVCESMAEMSLEPKGSLETGVWLDGLGWRGQRKAIVIEYTRDDDPAGDKYKFKQVVGCMACGGAREVAGKPYCAG